MKEGGSPMSYEKLFDLTHKVALVAGAAGGLAGETCLGLNRFGATLALADVDAKGLTRVCNELGVAKEIEEAIHFAEKECTDIDPEPFDILRGVYATN